MGFRLTACFSSPVEPDIKQAMLAEAHSQWSFIRLPKRDVRYNQHVQFAPPELTEYLFDTDDENERAVEQSREVEDGLPDFSRRYSGATLVFIEADCFGGTCVYTGFACKSGEVILRQDSDLSGHRPLLEQVGITLKKDHFAPFERGYFEE